MARHLVAQSRVRSTTKRFAPLLAAATALPVTLVLAGAVGGGTGQAAAAADVQSVRTFACPGTALEVRETGQSDLELACRHGVSQVGALRSSTTRYPDAVTTQLPSGAAAGQLLVAVVQTSALSAVEMSGWTKAYDTVSGDRGVRLSAWYRTATANDHEAVAAISPASRASIIASAFADARTEAPLGSAGAAAGLTAPPAATAADGAVWVSNAGIQGWGARLQPPAGTRGGRVVTNGATR